MMKIRQKRNLQLAPVCETFLMAGWGIPTKNRWNKIREGYIPPNTYIAIVVLCTLLINHSLLVS